jgi:sugar phosphate isomerase/epimerase/peptidoglycan/xylan/chitin deacetylase (PgdA/CDA1 family)
MAGHDEAHAGPVRDFAGYGRRTPLVRWPGDASLVVNIVLNYESGAEYSLPDGDGRNDSWGEYSHQIGPHVRDLGTETHFEFGSRAGIWRLARLFDGYQVPITIGACARALERNPEVAEWIAAAGHDVIGHGYRWAENSEMTREQERDDLRRGIDSIARLTGERPLGWYCRSFPSIHTRELIVENLRAAVGYLCDEAAAGHGARMMTVGLHERWGGQASRATAIRDFVEYVASRPDVRFMRRLDIARWWLAHHAEWDKAPGTSGGQPPGTRGTGKRQQRIRGTRADPPAAAFGSRVGLLSSALPGLAPAAICAGAAGAGLDGVEWAAAHSEGPGRRAASAQAGELWRLAGEHGLAVVGLAAGDDRAVTGRAGEFERLLDLAEAMGAPQLRCSAPPYEGGDVGDELRRLAERLAERAALAGSRDVRLLVAIAPGTLIPGPEWFRRAARDLAPERIGAVYDPGGMVVEGRVAPRLAIAGLGRYLQHVHVKDLLPRHANSAWDWVPALPGAGLVSWPGVLAVLAAADYGGWLVIDQLSGPARPGRLQRDVAAVRRLVAGTPARPISRARSATGPAPATEGDRP